MLLEDVGLEKISSAIKHPLKGLKVACYYGCLLVRPPKVVNFDDPENPKSLDKLVKAIGGEVNRLAIQGRMLRRRVVAFEDGRGGQSYGFDSWNGQKFGRGLHSGKLPDVPG